MAYFPTPEQVAIAWLAGLAVVPAGKVATTLPGDPATWSADGFVQVTSVGGEVADPGIPHTLAVVTVDCWANTPNGARPPWGKAGHLAAGIVHAASKNVVPARLDLGANFHPVRLLTVYPVSPVRRVPGDPSGFARYQADLAFAYALAVAA